MKFGKSLNNQIVETLPEWRDKFLSYKDLKKRLKLLGGASADERRSKRQRVGDGSPPAMTADEAAFVALLEAELDKFNGFFLEITRLLALPLPCTLHSGGAHEHQEGSGMKHDWAHSSLWQITRLLSLLLSIDSGSDFAHYFRLGAMYSVFVFIIYIILELL